MHIGSADTMTFAENCLVIDGVKMSGLTSIDFASSNPITIHDFDSNNLQADGTFSYHDVTISGVKTIISGDTTYSFQEDGWFESIKLDNLDASYYSQNNNDTVFLNNISSSCALYTQDGDDTIKLTEYTGGKIDGGNGNDTLILAKPCNFEITLNDDENLILTDTSTKSEL